LEEQLPTERQSDKLKRFEAIREESIQALTCYLDGKLTQMLSDFINREDIAKKIKLISEHDFQRDLTQPINDACREVESAFYKELTALNQQLEELVALKEAQLEELKVQLKKTQNRNNSEQVVRLKVF